MGRFKFIPYTYQNKNVVILINTLYFVILSEIIVGSISRSNIFQLGIDRIQYAFLEISTS